MMATCPHCALDLIAERTDDGVWIPYGPAPRFVVSARCPHPSCAQPVAARAATKLEPFSRHGEALEPLGTVAEALRWSPLALVRGATAWSWPCALLLGFGLVPAWGWSTATRARSGELALEAHLAGWIFYIAGSLLALVPVVCFTRALLGVAIDAVRSARRARAEIRRGAAVGLRLHPEPAGYRGGGSGRTIPYCGGMKRSR